MEKFGIFELLDALSAIALSQEEENNGDSEQESASYFAPPSYDESNAPVSVPTPEKEQAGHFAIDAFLKAHDERAKGK